MISGVFNSIINSGLRAVRAASTIAGRALSKVFNAVCKALAQAFRGAPAAPAADGTPLRLRFNIHCNDNVGFDGERNEEPGKAARIAHLMSFLKNILQRVAEGAAQVADAQAIVTELSKLGVEVAGLLVLHPHPEFALCPTNTPMYTGRAPAFA
jgi:hypothetical protein